AASCPSNSMPADAEVSSETSRAAARAASASMAARTRSQEAELRDGAATGSADPGAGGRRAGGGGGDGGGPRVAQRTDDLGRAGEAGDGAAAHRGELAQQVGVDRRQVVGGGVRGGAQRTGELRDDRHG